MKNYLQKKLGNEKGMTLIELLAVIVIIAIIAAIAIPAIGNIIENSRYSAIKSDATNVLSAAQIYYAENAQATTVTIADLKSGGYLDTPGKISAGTIAKPTTGAIALTTAAITYSGSKKVTFTSAKIENITGDTAKGSATGDKVINATTGN